MRKFLSDFLYYVRLGFGIRTAWRLAKITL